jgi:hypothetical protein
VTAPTVTPVQNDLYVAIKKFIASVVPTNTPIYQGLGNRVAAPLPLSGFVYMTMLYQKRLQTNIDTWDTTTPTPTELAAQNAIEVGVQLDVYGPNAFDWAAMLSTLWRDDYGFYQLAPNCAPLYADEARQMPLVDSEAQYEQRFTITAVLQYNPTTVFPQTFADSLGINIIDVNEAYAP